MASVCHIRVEHRACRVQSVVLQKSQGPVLQANSAAGRLPRQASGGTSMPIGSTQVTVRLLVPPPQVALHTVKAPTCGT